MADVMLSRLYVILLTPMAGAAWAFPSVCLAIAIGFLSIGLSVRRHRLRNNTQNRRVDRETGPLGPRPVDGDVTDEPNVAANA